MTVEVSTHVDGGVRITASTAYDVLVLSGMAMVADLWVGHCIASYGTVKGTLFGVDGGKVEQLIREIRNACDRTVFVAKMEG